LGEVVDRVLAERYGVSVDTIFKARRRQEIPASMTYVRSTGGLFAGSDFKGQANFDDINKYLQGWGR
jgi:hypothetical protein